MARSDRRALWIGIAVAFLAAAATHVVAIARGEPPVGRHALFVAINAVAALGVIVRPRGFWIAFAALTAQQLYSHGGAAIRAWRDEARIDWASIVVVVGMPIVLAMLIKDPGTASPAPPAPGSSRRRS